MDYPSGHEDPRITERDRAWARMMIGQHSRPRPMGARSQLAIGILLLSVLGFIVALAAHILSRVAR